MSCTMRIAVNAGEKLYLNGAVIRFDRKCSVELMNDATFLLEAHVIQAKDATTPLRQLYFIVQTMLMDPNEAKAAECVFDASLRRLEEAFETPDILAGLHTAKELMDAGRIYETLKAIRALFPLEETILGESGGALQAA